MSNSEHHTDGATIDAAVDPRPCANNCGFFGSSTTMNLCSKCFKAAVQETNVTCFKTAVKLGAASEEAAAASPSPPVAASRCRSCRRKVGLLGFVCKCGSTFCGAHRPAEMHGCDFDYKTGGREAIRAANPVLMLDKMTRF